MLTIEIPMKEYVQLLKDSERLARLDAGGVDNWDWYGASLYPEDEEPFDEFCERIDKQFAYI